VFLSIGSYFLITRKLINPYLRLCERAGARADISGRVQGSGAFMTSLRSLEALIDEIEESRERDRMILDYSPDVICSIDLEFRVLAINLACNRLWQYAPKALLGRPIARAILP
jgi:PAS domain-containing protein